MSVAVVSCRQCAARELVECRRLPSQKKARMNYLMRAFGVIFAVCGGFLLSLLIFHPDAAHARDAVVCQGLAPPAMTSSLTAMSRTTVPPGVDP